MTTDRHLSKTNNLHVLSVGSFLSSNPYSHDWQLVLILLISKDDEEDRGIFATK